MKKLMLVTVVTLASVSAFASKARLNSLQDAAHLSDIQHVFTFKPEQVVNYEAATVEFGSNSGTAPEAEGGFVRKMGDSAWSLYLGSNSDTFQTGTDVVADTFGTTDDETAALQAALNQNNPLQLGYGAKTGDMSWGVNFFYVADKEKQNETFSSNAENFTAKNETNVMGILVGATNGVWDAQLRMGLQGEAKLNDITAGTMAGLAGTTDLELESTSSYKLSGGYVMGTMYYYGRYEAATGELKRNGTKSTDNSSSTITVGAVNSMKKDGTDFFYGASVVMATTKEDIGNDKTTSTTVPLLVGVESEVSSWLTLRGSLTQNVGMLSSEKVTDNGVTTADGSSDDSTTAALGAGFKWGKAMVDFTLGTGSTGTFGLDDDGDNFATAAVTYNF